MTTDTKIKSPRDVLTQDIARYEIMLDKMSKAAGESIEEGRHLTVGLLVASGLVLVARALLDVSDSVDSIYAGLHDVAARNPGQGR